MRSIGLVIPVLCVAGLSAQTQTGRGARPTEPPHKRAAAAGGKTLTVDTAQPTYLAVATPAGGLNVDAMWVGFGSDADIAMAPDVRGKAAFFYSTDIASRHVGVMDGAIKRLGDRGAAAIF